MFPKTVDLKQIKAVFRNTMMDHLGIEITELGADYIAATMPVRPETHQPLGFLHGGASLALAESLGSTASYLLIDKRKYTVFGLEINANHIRSKRGGMVTAVARPVHLGKKTHVWDIRITDEEGKLISIARLTNIITELNHA